MNGLHVSGKAVTEYAASGGDPSTVQSYRRKAFGYNGSIMVAGRASGYRSAPHVHDSEQLNYQITGELYIYVENKVFFLKEGDFLRVPANTIRWASSEPDKKRSELFEFHSPALTKGSVWQSDIVALFDEGEPAQPEAP